MKNQPLCLIIGGNDLTERVCSELHAVGRHRLRVAWISEANRQNSFLQLGAEIVSFEVDSDESLLAVGIMDASAVIVLAEEDRINFSLAIRIRHLNPTVRIIIRQFSASLGTRIGQMLPGCQAFSLVAHCAAMYAAAGLDPSYFYALQYPTDVGPLFVFGEKSAQALGVSGLTVGQAEAKLQCRIIALNTHCEPPTNTAIAAEDQVVSFGLALEPFSPAPQRLSEPKPSKRSGALHNFVKTFHSKARSWLRYTNPILRISIISAVIFFSASFSFFHFILGKNLTSSMFYVVETMTNVGFGEVQVTQRGPLVTLCAIVAMLGGIIFTSIFIGAVASTLTRAQWIAAQGLRRIRAKNHVIICGGGTIGSAVLELLTAVGKRVVIVEEYPDAALVNRARDSDVDLLTGDPSRVDTFALCNLNDATTVLALTDSDTINLEVALGARLRAPTLPLVVRMHNVGFAHATKNLFDISTYSPIDLCAPIFAGLVDAPGMRGKLRFANRSFTIEERATGHPPDHQPAWDCIPLCLWREGRLIFVRHWSEVQPFEAALYAVPFE